MCDSLHKGPNKSFSLDLFLVQMKKIKIKLNMSAVEATEFSWKCVLANNTLGFFPSHTHSGIKRARLRV